MMKEHSLPLVLVRAPTFPLRPPNLIHTLPFQSLPPPPGSSLHVPGSRQCVGKGLALVELRLVAAVLLKRFKVRFADGHDPETLWRDLRDQVTAQPGQCWCVFEPREAGV